MSLLLATLLAVLLAGVPVFERLSVTPGSGPVWRLTTGAVPFVVHEIITEMQTGMKTRLDTAAAIFI